LDLFSPVVDASRFHPHFKSVLIATRKAERDLITAWAEGFVDRDGKLVEEFQTTFNSSFWEIYLHAAFKEYGFAIDWGHATPDFLLSAGGVEVVVEATTANAAQGKPNEWDRVFDPEELRRLKFKPLNTEAIIRLSNSIVSKVRKFERTYRDLAHVKGRPFVLAVAPFEQPHFNLQFDRPIRALLYDHYVDEDAFLENPGLYPDGLPPTVHLGHVEKDNGAEIPLPDQLSSSLGSVDTAQQRWLSPILNPNSRPPYIGSWNATAMFMCALFAQPALAATHMAAKPLLPPGGPIYAGLQLLFRARVLLNEPEGSQLDDQAFEPGSLYINNQRLVELLHGMDDWSLVDVHSGVYMLATPRIRIPGSGA
jgi:hypothetical protein